MRFEGIEFGKRGGEKPAANPEKQAQLDKLDEEEKALDAFQNVDGVYDDSKERERIQEERKRLEGGSM